MLTEMTNIWAAFNNLLVRPAAFSFKITMLF